MSPSTSHPKVNSKVLSLLGIIAALLMPWMMIIMDRSIFGFGMQIILTLASLVLFLAALIYDNQNIEYNRTLGYTSNLSKRQTYPENMLRIHRQFILVSLGLTIGLFPFYAITAYLLAIAMGWITASI